MKNQDQHVREARIIAAQCNPGIAKRLPQGYSHKFEAERKAWDARKAVKNPPLTKKRDLAWQMQEKGHSIQEIAQKLKISVKAVSCNIYEYKKLHK